MAFVINPNEGDSGGSGAAPRPDVRAGRKILSCVGITGGTTQGGNPKWSTTWVVVQDPDGGQDVGALVFETLTLTERAAWKIRIIAQAVGQSASWNAEDQEAMYKVLSRAPVVAKIELAESRTGRTDRDGNVRMEAEVKGWYRYSGSLTDDERTVIRDGQSWYKAWRAKKDGGSTAAPPKRGGPPDQWDGGSSGGSYDHDDIPF